MKNKQLLKLIFQLVTIVTLWGLLVHWHYEELQLAWAQPAATSFERCQSALRAVVGLPVTTPSPNQSIVTIQTPTVPQEEINMAAWSEDLVTQVNQWHESIDLVALNEALVARDQTEAFYDADLLLTTSQRAQELSDYYYLGATDLSGAPIEVIYADHLTSDLNLSEALYELYLPKQNIHWQTWQQVDLLADYLFEEIFATVDQSLIYSQALSVAVGGYVDPETGQEFMRLVAVLAYYHY